MQNLQALDVLDIPTSKIPAHIEKNGIANFKACGEYQFQFAFSHDSFTEF